MTEVHRLINQHESLFEAQGHNWDEFERKIFRTMTAAAVSIIAGIFSALVSNWTLPWVTGSLVFGLSIIAPFLAFLIGWWFSIQHRLIDRQLEEEKTQIEEQVERIYADLGEDPPMFAIAVRVRFNKPRPSKPGRRRRVVASYSPWEDFEYGMYWTR